MFCRSLGIGLRSLRRMKDFLWKQVGIVRAKIFNDGTFFSVLMNYFKQCGFINYKKLAGFISKLSPVQISKLNSHLNVWAKRDLSKQFPDQQWIKIVDLHTLAGYPKTVHRVFNDDVANWLVNDTTECLMGVSEIKSHIYSILGRVLFNNNSGNGGYTSFKQWVKARFTWMGQGAGKGSNLEVDGVKIRSKEAVALSNTDEQLFKLIRLDKTYSSGLRSFVKSDEKGVKGRYVVNVPLGLFLRQKFYLDHIINNTIKDENMTMFKSTTFKVDTIKNSLNTGVVHIPVDFEAFDHNISIKYWQAFDEYCQENLQGDFKVCAKEVFGAFGVMDVYDSEGKVRGKWNKGMPSGLYATSFCNSLFNLVMQREAERASGGEFKAGFGQGDDGDMTHGVEKRLHYEYNVSVDLKSLSNAFSRTGSIINTSKNWVTPGKTEFLKMLINLDSVLQYPARAFATLVWAFPASFKDNDILAKLNTLAGAWKEVGDRLRLDLDLIVVEDIQKAVLGKLGWKKDMVYSWLHTPTGMGGFGLLPFVNKYIFKTKTVASRLKTKGLVFTGYPFTKNQVVSLRVIKNNDRTEIINTISEKEISVYTLARTQTPTWDDYVNYVRAKKGLKNKFGAMVHTKKAASEVLFRVPFLSDLFVKEDIGSVRLKTTTQLYLAFLSGFQWLIDSKKYFSYTQLWK